MGQTARGKGRKCGFPCQCTVFRALRLADRAWDVELRLRVASRFGIFRCLALGVGCQLDQRDRQMALMLRVLKAPGLGCVEDPESMGSDAEICRRHEAHSGYSARWSGSTASSWFAARLTGATQRNTAAVDPDVPPLENVICPLNVSLGDGDAYGRCGHPTTTAADDAK